MNTGLLLTFIGLNIANVIIQTVKSIATIKCGKGVAALVNAGAYGLYTVVTVYMLCDLPLFAKASIVALCNLVGVYVVKYFEEKARKDKLWEIKATFLANEATYKDYIDALRGAGISCNWMNAGKYVITHAYAETQDQSRQVRETLHQYNKVKYFISETKNF